MISDKTIEQLQEAVNTQTIQVGKETFTTREVHLLPERTPHQPKHLSVATLSGFVEYVKSFARKDSPEGDLLIQVAGPDRVWLSSALYSGFDIRDYFINAALESIFGKSFTFGEWYDHESFVIALQSLFVNADDRAKVLQVIGTIRESQVKEHTDDGVTQKVTASAGQVLVTELPVPNPVYLRPFRTFREIEQPASLFVLRVRTGKTKPECALFEADGGAWKLEAINSIASYLRERISDITILA